LRAKGGLDPVRSEGLILCARKCGVKHPILIFRIAPKLRHAHDEREASTMIFDAVGTLKGGAMITEKLIAADAEVREKLSLDSIPDARWKRTIGLALLLLCQRVPFARRWLCHLGLRTKPGWFARRIVEVPLPNGSHL